MSNIHRILVYRLFWAWLLISLLIGGIWFCAELKRIDEGMIALAASESEAFSPESLPFSDRLSLFDLEAWRSRALVLARQRFVYIELYDQNGKQLTEVVNPRHAAIVGEVRQRYLPFPLDGRPHFKKRNVNSEVVVQILVPVRGKQMTVDGYFAGAFVVDQATLERLNSNLVRTLISILLTIFLTTLALYPIIVSLNRDVLNFSTQILHANIEMAAALGAAVAIRDSETNSHNYRVTLYAICLGELVGLVAEDMRRLIIGAFLHDVGKIGISDNILLKPGPLTEEECTIMHTHVDLGIEIIRTSKWLNAGREVVENHHEMFNGKGYPRGLAGPEIPLNARIFSIVDVFDALSSARPYKKAFPLAECMAILQHEAGLRFDPDLVCRFEEIAADIHARLQAMDEAAMIDWLGNKSSIYFLPLSLKGLRPEAFFQHKDMRI